MGKNQIFKAITLLFIFKSSIFLNSSNSQYIQASICEI